MNYKDVVATGMILSRKNKYTMTDVYKVMAASLINPVNGRTVDRNLAAHIVRCSAAYHGTDFSENVCRCSGTGAPY